MDIITTDPAPTTGLTQVEVDAIGAFAQAEKSPGTCRAYASDFAIFAAWCRAGAGDRAARRITGSGGSIIFLDRKFPPK